MPLYRFACLNGHQQDVFCHVPADVGVETRICACAHSTAPVFSPGLGGLTYFGEGASGRWISNLGDQPLFITSPAQHRAAMKQAGVEWATRWITHKSGGWV